MRISFIVLLLLCGCQLGPQYQAPCVDTPEDWKSCSCDPSPGDPIAYWWEIFDDPFLDELALNAIENSPDLYSALQKVVEARALAKVNRAGLYPHVLLQPSYSDIDSLFKLYLPPGIQFPGATVLEEDFRVQQFLYTLPFNFSYELDLWGKLRGEYTSALRTAEAEAEAFQTALLTLTTDLASAYFQLRALDAQIDLLKETLALRHESLDLAKARNSKGVANDSEVANAQLAVSNVEADLFDVRRERALQENALAVLVGEPASSFCIQSLPLRELPPCVPAGLPAEILLQRPDLAQAERERASRHALIGVTYASFFPSLNITSTLGWLSPDLTHFLSWISRLFKLGVNMSQPIFEGGKNCANLEAAWARFRQADAEYQQRVLVAFQEVENALVNLELREKQATSLQHSVEAATELNHLSQKRYARGLVSYLEVVDSQKSQLDAQRTYVTLLGARYLSTIQLIKALGGSWSFQALAEKPGC